MALSSNQQGGSIYIFGLGIRTISHISLETNFLLQQMEEVFHSNTDIRVGEYLKSIGCKENNLSNLYSEGKQREIVYQEICDTVVEAALKGVKCAYLAGGNPIFLNTVVLKLKQVAEKKGIRIFLYPGISSIDTILNDLVLPVGNLGLQCYEATHFVRMKPVIDVRVPLFLFQPAVVELSEIQKTDKVNLNGIRLLQEVLVLLYGPSQQWLMVGSSESNETNENITTGLLSDLEINAQHLAWGTLVIVGS